MRIKAFYFARSRRLFLLGANSFIDLLPGIEYKEELNAGELWVNISKMPVLPPRKSMKKGKPGKRKTKVVKKEIKSGVLTFRGENGQDAEGKNEESRGA
jgi:hypothetical protein